MPDQAKVYKSSSYYLPGLNFFPDPIHARKDIVGVHTGPKRPSHLFTGPKIFGQIQPMDQSWAQGQNLYKRWGLIELGVPRAA